MNGYCCKNVDRARFAWRSTSVMALLMLICCLSAMRVEAQVFNSGSDGSDGVYAPTGPAGTVINFDPAQFHGTQVSANIFNFTSITIPVGLTVRLSGNLIRGPFVW